MNEEELWGAYRNQPQGDDRLRDPATAVAMAKCLLIRLGFETQDSHPERCRYCDMPTSTLVNIYEEWLTWSGVQRPATQHQTVTMFESLPKEIQAQEVRKAQGYVRKVHQAPDSDNGAEPGAAPEVAETGGQEVGPSSVDDPGWAASPRAANRASRGVRRGESETVARGQETRDPEDDKRGPVEVLW